jgi:hypothetical protein
MRCPSLMIGVTLLGACTREPAHTAVEPASAAPAPPQPIGPGSTADPAPGAAQATTPPPAPSPPSATPSPAHTDASTHTGNATKAPSSTQARETPPPAEVPNAMPQPDPLQVARVGSLVTPPPRAKAPPCGADVEQQLRP